MNKKTLGNKALAIWITFLFTATVFFVFAQPTTAIEDSDVLLQYHLNEGSGSSITDSSGNGYTGNVYGDLTWVAGKLNNCYQGDGLNDYLYTTSTSVGNFAYNDDFSIEFWINGIIGGSGYKGVIGKFSSGQVGWVIETNGASNQLIFRFGQDSGHFWSVIGDTTLTNSVWHHVIMTYNGNGLASGVTIYYNASTSTKTVSLDSMTTGSCSNTEPITILQTPLLGVFNGKIDEVVIYTKALNQTEVDYRYNSGAGRENVHALPPEDACVFSSQSPASHTTGVSIATATWTTAINSPDGVTFNWTIATTPNVGTGSGNTASNGTKSCTLTGLQKATNYSVTVTSKTVTNNVWHNATYWFVTELYDMPTFTNVVPANGSTCVDRTTATYDFDLNGEEGNPAYAFILKEMSPWTTTTSSGGASASAFYGTAWRSQSFSTAVNDHITNISIRAKRVGVGSTVTMGLYTTATTFDGYIPTGSALQTSVIMNTSGWSTAYAWHDFVFDYDVVNTRLALVLAYPSGTASRYIYWSLANPGTYPFGNMAFSSNSGSTWSAVTYGGYDADFLVYYRNEHTLHSGSSGGANATININLYPPLNIGYTYQLELNASSPNSPLNTTYFSFTAGDNDYPYYTEGTIANGTTGIVVNPHWNIYLGDNQSDFDWSIECGAFSDSGVSDPDGTYWLNMTGLAYLTTHTVYVNVTDEGGSCPTPYMRNWTFTFDTVDANAPVIDFTPAPSDPVTISNPDHMYVNYTVNISDPDGFAMDYSIQCSNGDSKTGFGVSNSSIWINLTTSIALGMTYDMFVNVTNGFKWTNGTDSFTTRTNACISLGTPSPANNSIGVTIGGGWSIPFTDSDSPTYSDSINVSIEISNGDDYNAWILAPNTALCPYSGLAYTTLYTVWVNTTDEWGGAVNGIYYFTTAPYSMGGTPYMVYNTNQTFTFYDSNGTWVDFTTLAYNDWLYNSSDITAMDYYVHSGLLTINFTTLMVYEAFDIDFLNDLSVLYQDYSNSFLGADHGVFTITIIKRVPTYTFENTFNRTWNGDWIGFRTDKKEYSIGQDIVFSYRLPADTDPDYGIVWHKAPTWISGGGFWGWDSVFDNAVWRNPDVGLTLAYGQWITIIIDSTALVGGYPSVDTEYRINLGADDKYVFYWNDIPTLIGLQIRLLNTPLVPTGNLGIPSPASPDVGTLTTFPFNGTNNHGQVLITNTMSSGVGVAIPFQLGDTAIRYEFNIPSIYRIDLQVWNGATAYTTVDSIYPFYINSSTGNETYGWQVEYLEPQRKMIVAGYHPLEFVYSSLRPVSTKFTILNPDGETTRYSTQMTSPCRGMYSHMLPSTVPIGIWTVTMYGNETLSFNFSVVADENNYIDFVKLEYVADEQFQVYLIHDVNCLLKFYLKDANGNYIGKGSKIYIDKLTPNGIVTIEHAVVTPATGDWRVELWETNSRIEIRKLATYDCHVTYTASVPIDVPDNDLFPAIDPTLGFVVGLIITLFCLLIPFIISKALGGTIEVPALVYAFTCGLGLVVSVAFGFFPVWVLAFLLILGVIIMVILYLMGKSSGNGV